MDFLNDFGKRVSHVARSFTEKTREGMEVSRLSGDLRNAGAEVERLFAAYGRLCLAISEGDGDQAEADALLRRIREAQARVRALERQLDDARDQRRCPGCGSVLPRSARVCPGCGAALLEAQAADGAAETRYCPACGAALAGLDAACEVCGAAVDLQSAPQAPQPVELPEAPSERAAPGPGPEEPDDADME